MHKLFRDPCILLSFWFRGYQEAPSALKAIVVANGGKVLGVSQNAYFARFENKDQALVAGLEVLGTIPVRADSSGRDRSSPIGVNVCLDTGPEGPNGPESVVETLNGPVALKCLKLLSLCLELKVDFITTPEILQDEALGRDFFSNLPKPVQESRYAGTVHAGGNHFECVYELFTHNSPEVIEYKRKSARPLTHAINLIGQSRFSDAYQILVGLQRAQGALAVADTVVRHFLEQCRRKMEGIAPVESVHASKPE